ncbi:hypothetical protein HDU97_004313 [Phlyctochytrium planicorne]|nr:hypothetical protein HDU97_004313 [Phlyctochytrium planicorne]
MIASAAFILALVASATANSVFHETAFSAADCTRFHNTVHNMRSCKYLCKERNDRINTECIRSVNRRVNYQYTITVDDGRMRDPGSRGNSNFNSNPSPNRSPTFNLGWNEIAFTEADCRRFQQTLEPKCNGNESCKSYNWGKYYECSKRVNEEKQNYSWVSRIAIEYDDENSGDYFFDEEQFDGKNLEQGDLI